MKHLLLSISWCALLMAAANSVGLAAKVQGPNILWLITEDMGPELACYGTPQVWTPVLDSLARRGVRYQNAFTVTPVCSTSRSGFCTGMYPITVGAYQHRTSDRYKKNLPDGVKPVSHWLEDAGYYTANIKTRHGQRFGTGKVDWNFKISRAAFQASEWDELKNHQPFYAQVNFSQSHRGWSAPAKADPDQVTLPPYYPDHPAARKDWAQYLDEISEVDGLIGTVLESLQADGLADNTIVIMFGDHGRAHVRGKQWPYDSGLRVPLIIYVPPGVDKPANYRPGSTDQRLIASIDITATTLALAGIQKPPSMQGRVFLGAQSEPPRQYTYAHRDRCDMTTFRIRTVRDKRYRYIRNFLPDRPFFNLNLYKERSYPMIALMRQLHEEGRLTAAQDRLFSATRPHEELYDIDADPYEITNLADSDNSQHQAALKRLRAELKHWIERARDQGRQLEDPAIGLEVMQEALYRLNQSQREIVQAAIRQQMKSPGISEYYRDYLRTVQQQLDRAVAAGPAKKRRSKRNKRRNPKSKTQDPKSDAFNTD